MRRASISGDSIPINLNIASHFVLLCSDARGEKPTTKKELDYIPHETIGG